MTRGAQFVITHWKACILRRSEQNQKTLPQFSTENSKIALARRESLLTTQNIAQAVGNYKKFPVPNFFFAFLQVESQIKERVGIPEANFVRLIWRTFCALISVAQTISARLAQKSGSEYLRFPTRLEVGLYDRDQGSGVAGGRPAPGVTILG